MPQAYATKFLLYADDTCIVFQHESVIEIEQHLIRDFSNLCDWFADDKLSIHFRKDKKKSVLFGTKHKLRNVKSLNIVYNGIEIKQHAKVKYLGYTLHESIKCESMALSVIDKIYLRLKFLYRQNSFLIPILRRLSYHALKQPLFDYACTA